MKSKKKCYLCVNAKQNIMEFKGTKGGWEISGLINRDGSKNKTIVLTDKGAYTPNSVHKTYSTIKELEANAKLIAAAPELLEALQICLGHMTGGLDGSYENRDPTDVAIKAIEKALK